MTIEQIKSLIDPKLKAMNQLIITKAKEKNTLATEIIDYILSGGGKRIRPMIILLAAGACDYNGKDDISIAALVECLHTATLLHDDVIDNAFLRRGMPTVNNKWNNKTSILVGDFLFTLSISLMTEVNNHGIQNLFAKSSHEITCGELKQLSLQYTASQNIEDYLEIIKCKTAILFALSATIGPMLISEDHPLKQAFYNYGLHLGQAFQLIDDTLDYSNDEQTTGKSVGVDLAEGKATLPLLHILKHGNELQKKLVTTSLIDGSKEHFTDILDAIEATGAIEYTRAIAHREKDLAIKAIAVIPDSSYKQGLIELANFALERNH